ncbi:MAG TPA: glycosyltransferase family 2 protein [Azospirillum sp.]|nr:glycosyltransferase family 2 protein [Azospirillum sp.]
MPAHFGFRPGKRPPPPPELPLYSLITIVRNAADTLERTLQSVERQTYPAVEYIVVDAGSTDGTVDILKKYEHLITYWCSEPDGGHADAANKGVKQAAGRFIGFVYADDWLADDFIEKTADILSNGKYDYVFGDMNLIKDGEFAFRLLGDPNFKSKLSYRVPVMNFPTVSACAHVYQKAGLFDMAYKVAPDNDWLLRVHKAGFEGKYDPRIISNFSFGGHSTKNIGTVYIETARSAVRYGANPVKAWGFAGIKIAFHTLDGLLRDSVSLSTYVRIRAIRKSITG